MVRPAEGSEASPVYEAQTLRSAQGDTIREVATTFTIGIKNGIAYIAGLWRDFIVAVFLLLYVCEKEIP
jgi:hypothetical protein